MAQYLKILKPKTRPVQIEPWFFRYLNAGQIKVLSAIIAHADYATRSKDSFASNKTIAFYGGFGLINSDTKDYEYFQTLTTDEKITYKKKKIRNAIQTVKNIKRQLEELGVIKREIIDTKSYAVVDLEWSKERYLKEFDEYFNDTQAETQPTENEINKELEIITKLANEGNISKDNLAAQLENLTSKLKSEISDKKLDIEIPVEDIDKTVKHIMNTKKIQDRISTGNIKNPDGYKNTIRKQIENNTFNGTTKYYNGLVLKELDSIIDLITPAFTPIEKNNEILELYKIFFDKEKNILFANYKSTTTSYQINQAIINDLIVQIIDPEDYTKTTKNFISNYTSNYIKASQSTIKNE